jgi:hypothetical protein
LFFKINGKKNQRLFDPQKKVRIRASLIPKTFPKNQNQRFFDFQIFKSPKEPEVIIKILKAWADLFFSVLVGQLT